MAIVINADAPRTKGCGRLFRSNLLHVVIATFSVSVLVWMLWSSIADRHVQTIRWYKFKDRPLETDQSNVLYFKTSDQEGKKRCPSLLSKEDLARSRKNLVEVIKILDGLGVRAAICHGTLWGVLRRGDLLPWDANADVCVLKDELLRGKLEKDGEVELINGGGRGSGGSRGGKEVDLIRGLSDAGYTVSDYDWWLGHYRLNDTRSPQRNTPHINLRVFSDCTRFFYWTHLYQYGNEYPDYLEKPAPPDPRWACPDSLAFYTFYWSGDNYRGLPKFLLEPPFKTLKMSGLRVPVPHDDYEIQKYLYPNDWWLERTPPNCE